MFTTFAASRSGVLLVVVVLAVVLAGLLQLWRRANAARTRAEGRARLADELQALAAALSRVRTPAEVIDACMTQMSRALEATASALVLVSEDGQCGELARTIGYPEPLAIPERFPLSIRTPL